MARRVCGSLRDPCIPQAQLPAHHHWLFIGMNSSSVLCVCILRLLLRLRLMRARSMTSDSNFRCTDCDTQSFPSRQTSLHSTACCSCSALLARAVEALYVLDYELREWMERRESVEATGLKKRLRLAAKKSAARAAAARSAGCQAAAAARDGGRPQGGSCERRATLISHISLRYDPSTRAMSVSRTLYV